MARTDDLSKLPPDLPVPADDGAANHLRGTSLPGLALPSTAGRLVRLDELHARFVVFYCYPRTGRPDEEPLGGLDAWNAIPGARGCTPQACSYRDHHAELAGLGAEVFGVSTQATAYQREMVERLHLPFEVLSDAELALTRALHLPTFDVAGETLLKRSTLIVERGRIAEVFYPVFPPDADAARVVAWLRERALPASTPTIPAKEPFGAKLHFIPRVLLKPIQSAVVRVLRRYFERAPGWVLLTTTGRKTGLPREVLLPCERTRDGLYVISTYGRRSDWMRNLARDPRVRVTAAGWTIAARAEIVDDEARKRAIVSEAPFFPPMPIAPLNLLHRTLLRIPTVAFLRWWVTNRPVVLLRPLEDPS